MPSGVAVPILVAVRKTGLPRAGTSTCSSHGADAAARRISLPLEIGLRPFETAPNPRRKPSGAPLRRALRQYLTNIPSPAQEAGRNSGPGPRELRTSYEGHRADSSGPAVRQGG